VTGAIDPVERFIARWQGRVGGQERANYGLVLSELCDTLRVARPEPASATTAENDYVFERAVREPAAEGTAATGRIDLYKKNCFVLEARQSRQPGGKKEVPTQPELFPRTEAGRGARTATRAWDVLMRNARGQAERYARALPVDHGWPPFILICDVAQTAAVMAALASSTAPVGSEALAAGFRQGRRALPQINAVLASLVRMGFVASPDGGRTYIMRRAA
jgi:hypothetical protein